MYIQVSVWTCEGQDDRSNVQTVLGIYSPPDEIEQRNDFKYNGILNISIEQRSLIEIQINGIGNSGCPA